MNFANYFANNVPLFCLCAVMIYLSFRNIKIRRKESILFLVFTTIVVFLSVVVAIEKYSQRVDLPVLGTIFTFLGYIFRPVLLYIFILLANMEQKRTRRFYLVLGIPLIANLIIYIFPLFIGVDGVSKLVFYYQSNGNGTASFIRGSFLNFSSHFVCGLYLLALVYVSTLRFHGKHRRDGLVLVLCVFIIVITVTTEMLADRNDLLNIVCEICAMINYIFIISVNSSKDPLTSLYDRRTYYEDISRFKDLVNGIVQIDMNELKFLNDNYGHEAGDVALAELASIFEESVNKSTMCVYRLSGDEFLILMYQGKKEDLERAVKMIKEKVDQSNYSAAIGAYYYEKDEHISYKDALKKAEVIMYKDKDDHYKQSGHDRRRSKQ